MDLIFGEADAVLQEEGENGDDEDIEEEIGPQSDGDGGDDEESILQSSCQRGGICEGGETVNAYTPPSQADGFDRVVSFQLCVVQKAFPE